MNLLGSETRVKVKNIENDKKLENDEVKPLINQNIDDILLKIQERKKKILEQRKNITSKLNKLGIKI